MPDSSTENSTPSQSHAKSYEFYDDPLYVSSTDQPYLKIIGYEFDGTGFLNRKRDVYMALSAKNKEVFIDGSYKKHAITTCTYRQWVRCDILVTKWIQYALIKEIKESLTYVKSTKELWGELLDRYGQPNAIEIYQIKPDLTAVKQDNSLLVEYYSKLNVLAEAHAYATDRASSHKQPPFKKAKVDGDSATPPKKICDHCNRVGHAISECYQLQTCAYCGTKRHIIGICRSYKKAKSKSKGKGPPMTYHTGSNVYHRGANNVDIIGTSNYEAVTPLNEQPAAPDQATPMSFDSAMVDGIISLVTKSVLQAISDKSSLSHSANFADVTTDSTAYSVNSTCINSQWIIDTDASDHMTSNKDILHDIKHLPKPLLIGLPDGTIKTVKMTGTVYLSASITLKNVLLVLDFKQNLLSVGRIIENTKLCVIFYPQHCLFQNLSSKVIIGQGTRVQDLYIFKSSFASALKNKIASHVHAALASPIPSHGVSANSFNAKTCNAHVQACKHSLGVDLLHARLGHISYDKLKHGCDSRVNGRVERKHKHLLDSARALKIHVNLTKRFSGHCIMASTYLINKMPTVTIGCKTPFELLLCTKPPTYDELRLSPGPHQDTNNSESYHNSCTDSHNDNVTQENTTSHIPNTNNNFQIRKSVRPRQLSTRLKNFQIPITLPGQKGQNAITTTEPANELATSTTTESASATAFSSHSFHSKVLKDLSDFSPSYIASLTNVLAEPEPLTYRLTATDPRWLQAMQQELDALDHNSTWELTTLPPGKKAIGCKWVYKVKYRADGSVERFKARLVAKGFNQVKDEDYKHTFSPVAKFTTVRTVIAVAAARGWPIHQLDINNAFLYGFLEEEVYMKPLEGYFKASRQWNVELTKFLKQQGFVQSREDYSLFTKDNETTKSFTVVVLYVDDVLLTGDNEQDIANIKSNLDKAFSIKDLGHLRYFLGLEVASNDTGTLLNQRKYITDILKDVGMENLASDLSLTAYSDADWGQCAFTCKSLSGYYILLGNSLVSWKTKKQRTVSKSTTESEYRSMSYTASEMVWLAALLKNLKIHVLMSITLFCDNRDAKHIAQNPVFHERTKHLSIDCHYVRDKLQEEFLVPKHVRTDLQLADLMTKPLGVV
ncbi:uncharacterized protein LOC141617045 [Silene latifolia]|uniref:uncharacterized protein LOC141617045 n=1 Tax=Silene latifolia TaxID=37657 RepID=UPI003D77C7CE